MNDHSKIEIFILSYNRPSYINEAIESALNQSLAPSKITILDNGSEPDVFTAIQSYVESKKVFWISAKPGKNAFWNLKRAFDLQTQPYALIMHDDDRLLSNFCKAQIDFLDSHNDVIAAGAACYTIDHLGQRTGILESHHFSKSNENLILTSPAEVSCFYLNSFIPFPSFVYRKGFAQKTPIKDSFFSKCADVIFITDLSDQGSIAFLQKPIWEYRIHKNQDSTFFSKSEKLNMIRYLLTKSWDQKNLYQKMYSLIVYLNKSIRIRFQSLLKN